MAFPWNQQMALIAAAERYLAELVRFMQDGPEPYAEIRFGDFSYDEAYWKPAMCYWAGIAKSLIEYLRSQGRPITSDEEETLASTTRAYGEPYESCAICGKFCDPEMMSMHSIASTGAEAPVCLNCEQIFAET